jgi:hypothetical protein
MSLRIHTLLKQVHQVNDYFLCGKLPLPVLDKNLNLVAHNFDKLKYQPLSGSFLFSVSVARNSKFFPAM